MSNWICDKCGATYIDVSHQEPSVLKQELEIRQLKELLKECRPYVMRNVIFTTINKAAEINKEDMKLVTQIDEVLK